jgi:mRNA-degrading endonuclease RelE of RelBE toxin-antitoxin system
MNYNFTPEFSKELKKLAKDWRSLPSDLELAKKALPLLYVLQGDEPEAALQLRREQFFLTKRATILTKTDDGKEVVKMRLDCASLGNKDMVRIVFVAIRDLGNITFIELYAKNSKNKDREDQARIKRYL